MDPPFSSKLDTSGQDRGHHGSAGPGVPPGLAGLSLAKRTFGISAVTSLRPDLLPWSRAWASSLPGNPGLLSRPAGDGHFPHPLPPPS